MIEQIEVLGQFDVRRDIPDPEIGLTTQITIEKQRKTNTFVGDQLNAAVDAAKNQKKYVRYLFYLLVFLNLKN